jgi:hypothetical protein
MPQRDDERGSERDPTLDIIDHVLGRLTGSRRDAVAAALAADPRLKAFEVWLREVDQLLSLAGDQIFDHPQTAELLTFAITPQDADPATAAHAVACPACRDLVAAARAIGLEPQEPPPVRRRLAAALRPRRPGRGLALGFGLGLVAMLLFGPLLRPPAAPPEGAIRTLYLEGTVRAVDIPTPSVAIAQASVVTLLIRVDPFVRAAGPQVAIGLALGRGGQTAYTWAGPASEVWNAQAGLLSFLIPVAGLAPGAYDLRLDVDGTTVVQRTVRFD